LTIREETTLRVQIRPTLTGQGAWDKEYLTNKKIPLEAKSEEG